MKTVKKVIIFLFFCVLSNSAAFAISHAADMPVLITATTDKSKITIGDKFTLIIEIKTNKDVIIENFNPVEALSQSFEVKDFKQIGPKWAWNKNKYIYSYRLSTFTTGVYRVPELVLQYKNKGSEELREIKSAPVDVTVEGVKPKPGDTDDIRDLKGIMGLGVSPWWFVFLGLIIIIAAGLWVWEYIQERKKREIVIDTADLRPADEVAFENLKKLKEGALLSEGRVKEYYIMLADILRQYIEKRFNMSVFDKTTLELYKQIRESDIDRKIVMEIKTLFDDCDLVKFAKYVPMDRDIENDWQNAFSIVEKTKPLIVMPEPAITEGVKS